MTEPLVVAPGVVVPEDAMQVHAVRSGGPGGQNVNKVSSKVELRVDLARIVGLDAAARARLRALVAGSVDSSGRLLVKSERTRDRHANLEDARGKVREAVREALVRPRVRRRTKPTRGSVERRIEEKKRRARVKAQRGES